MPSLLPCPFCGGGKIDAGQESMFRHGVHCKKCGATITRTIPDKMPRGCKSLKELEHRTLTEAIRAWNRRSRP